MIVWRWTAKAKYGRQGELVALIKSMKSTLPNPDAMRIYWSHPAGAPAYTIVTDIEFESLAALERWLTESTSGPSNAELMSKLEALQEPGGESTIWGVSK